MAVLFAAGGWGLGLQLSSDVNPRNLAAQLESAVYELYCGDYAGTAFAADLDIVDGYETVLVTAAHLVQDCEVGDTLELRGQSGFSSAILIATTSGLFFEEAPSTYGDLAILGAQFKSSKLKMAREVNRGDWAMAMGYPWSQEQYLSFGIVSDQNATELFVDAALNEGNSGGPVVNNRGQVMGVVSYGFNQADLFEGNVAGIYDRAEGITAVKKIRNLCSLPRNIIQDCSMFP
ncbi:serine protease [Aquiluna sp.]|nr:serine protease [Aquiluna sp.]MDA8992682.1 serine protease [Aquiluna sp.]